MVPDRPEWIHEIKHDGYRLIVQRENKRVRLFTRNGHDWSDRFPLIVEAALRNGAEGLANHGPFHVVLGKPAGPQVDLINPPGEGGFDRCRCCGR